MSAAAAAVAAMMTVAVAMEVAVAEVVAVVVAACNDGGGGSAGGDGGVDASAKAAAALARVDEARRGEAQQQRVARLELDTGSTADAIAAVGEVVTGHVGYGRASYAQRCTT